MINFSLEQRLPIKRPSFDYSRVVRHLIYNKNSMKRKKQFQMIRKT